MLPSDSFQLRRCSQVDRCPSRPLRAHHERTTHADENGHETTLVFSKTRPDNSGMQAIDRDPRSLQELCQLISEQDIGQLGLAVGVESTVLLLALKVFEFHPEAEVKRIFEPQNPLAFEPLKLNQEGFKVRLSHGRID